MDRQNSAAPIIIKRKKASGHDGHHGGAWKIAFADFATAMMAFFLVMWLINATDETMKRGLAAYFSPSIQLTRTSGVGDGAFGGQSVTSQERIAEHARFDARLHAEGEHPAEEDTAAAALSTEDEEGTTDTLEEIQRMLRGLGGESVVAEQALRHIVTRVTDEGLIVEVFDLPGQPLFEAETDTPTEILRVIARLLQEVFAEVENGVSVAGHLRTLPVVLADNPAWELSTDRAQRMRLLMQDAGVQAPRFVRVTGHADRKPAARNPAAVRNNRLEVVLLRDGTTPMRGASAP